MGFKLCLIDTNLATLFIEHSLCIILFADCILSSIHPFIYTLIHLPMYSLVLHSHPFIYLSITHPSKHLFMYSFIHPTINILLFHPFVHLLTHLSIHPFINLPIYSPIFPSHPFNHLFIHLGINPPLPSKHLHVCIHLFTEHAQMTFNFICPSICSTTHSFIHPSTHVFIHSCIHLSICPTIRPLFMLFFYPPNNKLTTFPSICSTTNSFIHPSIR